MDPCQPLRCRLDTARFRLTRLFNDAYRMICVGLQFALFLVLN